MSLPHEVNNHFSRGVTDTPLSVFSLVSRNVRKSVFLQEHGLVTNAPVLVWRQDQDPVPRPWGNPQALPSCPWPRTPWQCPGDVSPCPRAAAAGLVPAPHSPALLGPPKGPCPSPMPREVPSAWGWGCPGTPSCLAPGWGSGIGPDCQALPWTGSHCSWPRRPPGSAVPWQLLLSLIISVFLYFQCDCTSLFALPYLNRKYLSDEQSRQHGSIINSSASLPPSTATFTCLFCTFIMFTCVSCWVLAPFPLTHCPLEVQSASVLLRQLGVLPCLHFYGCWGSFFPPMQKSTALTVVLHYIHQTADEKKVVWLFIT